MKQFIEDVKRMRELQKEFFKNRNSLILKAAKEYEKKVDNHIKKLEAPEKDLFSNG